MTAAELPADDEFLAVAVQALAADPDGDLLATLGWWELLTELDDTDARSAVFAIFRAQGRQLAPSLALGGLMAQPYLDLLDAKPGSVVATIARPIAAGHAQLLVGRAEGATTLLVDVPGAGVWLIDAADAELAPIDIPGRLALFQITTEISGVPVIRSQDAAEARARSEQLGRLAAALEMLGAAESALSLACEHSAGREQFGAPIGKFQAVRHLLAWARTDCAAVEAVLAHAVLARYPMADGFDLVVKSLAGRNARRACERTLQVLGAIGFTTEYMHHHAHSRVLALDSLLGTSTELSATIGARFRTFAHEVEAPSGTLLIGEYQPAL